MKAVRDYMLTIRHSLKDWTDWTENGEKYIKEGKSFFFDILARKKELNALDAELVKDAILEHEDSIRLRLKRLDRDCKIVPTIEYYVKIEQKRAELSDLALNYMIDDILLLIRNKLEDLLRVYRECEKYIPSEPPIIEKAFENEYLLRYFKGNKDELKKYILFCEKAKNPTGMAQEAERLFERQVIDYENINTNLHRELKKIGINVGNPNNWKTATLKEYKKRHPLEK